MFADNKPEFIKSVSAGQAVQAQNITRRLHVPEGRVLPPKSGPVTTNSPRNGLYERAGAGVIPVWFGQQTRVTRASVLFRSFLIERRSGRPVSLFSYFKYDRFHFLPLG